MSSPAAISMAFVTKSEPWEKHAQRNFRENSLKRRIKK